MPEVQVRLANGRVHHAPVVHATVYSKAECEEEKHDAKLCTPSMAWPQYGAFRKDFARRQLAPGPAANYLEAQAAAWPGYDFGPEIAYYRARAVGERLCHACYAVLPPVPPCACGCQAPARAVAGFAPLGTCLAPGVTTAAAKAPAAQEGGPPGAAAAATHATGPAGAGLQPGPNGASTSGAKELGAGYAQEVGSGDEEQPADDDYPF